MLSCPSSPPRAGPTANIPGGPWRHSHPQKLPEKAVGAQTPEPRNKWWAWEEQHCTALPGNWGCSGASPPQRWLGACPVEDRRESSHPTLLSTARTRHTDGTGRLSGCGAEEVSSLLLGTHFRGCS